MKARFGPLVRTLLVARVRPWHTAILPWSAAIGSAALLGWLLASRSSPSTVPAMDWAERIHLALIGFLTIVAVLDAIDLVCRDEEAEWLLPLTSAGLPRRTYVLSAATTLALVHLPFAWVVFAAFTAPLVLNGIQSGTTSLDWVIGGGSYVLSAAFYGLTIGVLFRKRMRAMLAAAFLGVLPYAVVMGFTLRMGDPPRELYRRLFFLYVPPPNLGASSVGFHLAYVAVLLSLLLAGADRLIARKT